MKVFFWDWNGTLVDDSSVLCNVFNQVLEARGYAPVSLARYRELYRHPIRSMYEDMGVDLNRHSFEELAHEWHLIYQASASAIKLHHDSVTTLESLRARGARQMVLSALPQDVLDLAVNSYGLSSYFEHVAGVRDTSGHGKLAEGVSLWRKIGVPAHDLTIIGDSSHDAEVAQELAAHCILVARGAESRERLEVHGYPVVDSFDAVLSATANQGELLRLE